MCRNANKFTDIFARRVFGFTEANWIVHHIFFPVPLQLISKQVHTCRLTRSFNHTQKRNKAGIVNTECVAHISHPSAAQTQTQSRSMKNWIIHPSFASSPLNTLQPSRCTPSHTSHNKLHAPPALTWITALTKSPPILCGTLSQVSPLSCRRKSLGFNNGGRRMSKNPAAV